MSNKQLAVIDKIEIGPEDHGIETVWVHVRYQPNNCSYQGFGGLALTEKSQRAFVEDLMKAFKVSKPDLLVGKACYALKSFGGHNENIEGLESVDTHKRFTITGFRRKHFPGHKPNNRLEERIQDIKDDIARAKQTIKNRQEALKHVKDDYIDWEK